MRVRFIAVSGLFPKLRSALSVLSLRYYIGLGVVFLTVTAVWLAFAYFTRPAVLRIAVGSEVGSDLRMMTALEHMLEVHRAEVRLRLIATAGLEENYALLEKGDAELAILRADQGLPGDSTVVMILRKSVIVVVAPSSLGLENFSQLKGKRLGLVARSPLDQEGFAKLLTFYGMQKSDIKLTTIKPDQAGPLTDQRQLDAVMVIGPIVDPEVSAVVYAIDRKTKSGPSVLSIDLAALANKNALAASSDTIPQHAFPRRQIPAEEVDTISVPTIIAGNTASGPVREKIRTQAIMQLAQNLIERRMELSRKLGFVVPIEAPENEKGSRMPIHPGTAAYLDSTDIGWYTLFSDQIWTVWLVGGALFSIVAAFFGFLRARKDNPLQEFLRRLNEIAQQAKASLTPDELDVLTENLTDLGVELSALGYERRDDIDSFAPAQLAFENARFAIQTARERKMKKPPFKDDEALQRTAPQRG